MERRHICNKETEIELIKQSLEQQQELLQDIHHRLVGNGNPGLLRDVNLLTHTVHESEKTLKSHEHTLNSLNLKMAYYAGAIAVITFVVQIAVKLIIFK